MAHRPSPGGNPDPRATQRAIMQFRSDAPARLSHLDVVSISNYRMRRQRPPKTEQVVASIATRRIRAEIVEVGLIWRSLPLPLRLIGMACGYRVAAEIAGHDVLALLPRLV